MSQNRVGKTGLRADIEQAWDESCSRPEIDEVEKARLQEQEERFNQELLSLLEEKWGKSLVADRRTFMVEGVEYQLSGQEIYRDMEGEDAFVRRKALFALANKDSKISPEEKEKVEKLNKQLTDDYPKPRPRYAEIAKQLQITLSRVRYIVEQKRKTK